MKRYFCIVLFAFLIMLPSFAMADLNDGLVAYYPFDGNAKDMSGNGNDGVANGAILTTDRFGNDNSAYIFDGINDYIEISDNDMLDLPNIKTISLWFYLQVKNDDPNNVIINKYRADTPSEDGYTMGVNQFDDNEVFCWAKDENHNVTDLAKTDSDHKIVSVPYNTWIHFVFIFNNNQAFFYVNGVAINKESGILEISHGNNLPLIIGAGMNQYNSIYNYFHGKIDDIRIYNRALSESEIQELYNYNGDSSCTSSEYTKSDLQAKYNEGYEAGKKYCQENPSACGIDTETCSSTGTSSYDNCATYDFFSKILSIPCLKLDSKSYWLQLNNCQVIKYGENN